MIKVKYRDIRKAKYRWEKIKAQSNDTGQLQTYDKIKVHRPDVRKEQNMIKVQRKEKSKEQRHKYRKRTATETWQNYREKT